MELSWEKGEKWKTQSLHQKLEVTIIATEAAKRKTAAARSGTSDMAIEIKFSTSGALLASEDNARR